jgi:hypothetical protein
VEILAGLGEFGLLLGLVRGVLCFALQSREDDGGGLLDDFQALSQQCCVTVIQVDIVGVMLSST